MYLSNQVLAGSVKIDSKIIQKSFLFLRGGMLIVTFFSDRQSLTGH